MPVGSNGGSGNGDNISMANNSTTAAASNATTTTATSANTTSLQRPSTREPIEMLPRPPESRTITRSRSPSLDNGRLSNENDCSSSHSYSQNNEDYGLTFMGLKNLVPSDRFNEYVLGRSVKVSEVRFVGESSDVLYIIAVWIGCLSFVDLSTQALIPFYVSHTPYRRFIYFPIYTHRRTSPPKK